MTSNKTKYPYLDKVKLKGSEYGEDGGAIVYNEPRLREFFIPTHNKLHHASLTFAALCEREDCFPPNLLPVDMQDLKATRKQLEECVTYIKRILRAIRNNPPA
jgi:hypothetical protein